MTTHLPQLGAPDPERNTSPILEQQEERDPELDMENRVCYFNDVVYKVGDVVRCGPEVLRCEDGGVWIRQGEMRTDE